MKKFNSILVLLLFGLFSCQTDTVVTDTEAFENEGVELKRSDTAIPTVGEFQPIPEKFRDNPEAFLDTQLLFTAKDAVTYGCVTFENGLAYVDPDCGGISSGVPDDFDDCDLEGVRYLDCAVWADNPYCIICAVVFILECDGRLGWVIGYNIVCNYPTPQPYEPIPLENGGVISR